MQSGSRNPSPQLVYKKWIRGLIIRKDIVMNEEEARAVYDGIVDNNIRKRLKDYQDPDIPYEDTIIVKKSEWYSEGEIRLRMSSDGLCSVTKMQLMCKVDIDLLLKKYVLLRKGMFDCLKWPSYALSINTLRANRSFNDRIDLTLADIQRFYEVIDKKDISFGVFQDILNNPQLKLRYAYYNVMTFSWLKKFEEFENFISQNKLTEFVEMKNGKVVPWIAEEKYKNTFCEEYFNELCDRTISYKVSNGIAVV